VRELRNLPAGATWSTPLTSLTEPSWEEEGSSCTRRAEVEGLARGRGLAARGGAESLAPGPAPDLGPDPGPSLGTAPGLGLGPGLVAGTGPGTPEAEAEADHEMFKESYKQTL